MRFGVIAAVCVALGCGGAGKTEAKKVADEQQASEKMEKEAPKMEQTGPTMWKVDGDTVTTASGLKYLVRDAGTGELAKQHDNVVVHTTGWFQDGSKFYSSYDGAGTPLDFPLGATPPRVIAGWEEGLLLMKKGAKFQLICPPNLAYGEQGRPPAIPPSSTLIFDVELMDIRPAGK
ncbi:MAG: FKBP-type peptidyl-prolyl cis-trans isomerase [Calditrichaeota bacterium]|nr:FKBP-type peptidyl-prolyl cis-trans isomerase [Calditrichota bacterium]